MKDWKRWRHVLEAKGLWLLIRMVERMPRKMTLLLANLAGTFFFFFDKRGRKLAEENLRIAFGDKFNESERRKIARTAIQTMARNFFDSFWSANLNTENFRDYIQIEGEEYLGKEGDTRLLICPHFGAFEWSGLAVGFLGREMYFVAQEFKNEKVGKEFLRCRSRSGNHYISRKGAMIRLYKVLKAGGCVGMLPDLTIDPRMPSTVVTFFDREISVSIMHAVMHEKLGCSVSPVITWPQPDGRVKMVIYPPFEFKENMTTQEKIQLCWDFFENIVREHPEFWIWAYKHWRFLPEDAKIEYPSYANRSKRFEALRAK